MSDLQFPSSPALNAVYERWQWNGVAWDPLPSTPYVPLAGSVTMTGPIFYSGPFTAGTMLVNRDYVDQAVSQLQVFAGAWDCAGNDPDLTAVAVPANGTYYIASTGGTAPAALPGIGGDTVRPGDMVTWNTALMQWQIIPGAGMTQAEADVRYLQLAGGTMTGALILSAAPTATDPVLQAATKGYVDTRAVPTGGTQYQVLNKTSATDYAVAWTATGARPNSSTAVGQGAYNLTATGVGNVAVGLNALQAATSGNSNVAIGRLALAANTSAGGNTAVGDQALAVNVTGFSNTAVGLQALAANTASNNTACGAAALQANVTGANSVAIGAGALSASNYADQNVAVGAGTMTGAGGVWQSVAVGYQALRVTTGNSNTAIGWSAMGANTTGGYNVAVGIGALGSNIGGVNNVAVGANAMAANTSGTTSVAVGVEALWAETNAGYNTAVGYQAARANNGNGNTALGYQALFSNFGAEGNVAVGYQALSATVSGGSNTAVGYAALATNTGPNNTAVGASALMSNTSGGQNIAVGASALGSCTTGQDNICIGWVAGSGVTTGFSNIAIGSYTGGGTGAGGDNVGIGHAALSANSRYNNTVVGAYALQHNSGDNNTAIGTSAGAYQFATGSPGALTGAAGSLFIGARTYARTNTSSNEIVVGPDAVGMGNNTLTLGNTGITGIYAVPTTITGISDLRAKEEVAPADLDLCLDAVRRLPVSRWAWAAFAGAHLDRHVTGWTADDVERVFPKAVTISDRYFPTGGQDGDGHPEMRTMKDAKHTTMTEALPTLWGATQRLLEKIEALELEVMKLRGAMP